MTVAPEVPPVPARPTGPHRPPPHRRRARLPRGVLPFLGVALVLALILGSCGLLDGLDPVDPRRGHVAGGPAPARPAVRPLPMRWAIDRPDDPTALLVEDDDAFVVEPDAVSSVRVGDGTTRWRVRVTDAEPWIAADADTVLVGAIDGFEALRRDTGASRWRVAIADHDDRGRTVALVRTTAGPMAVLTTQRGGVVGVDARSGATRWSATVDGSPRGRLVADDGTGVVVLAMDHDARVELHVLDGATGAERWSSGLGVMTGLPLVDGPRLVVDTGGIDTAGTVVAFDLATGARRWSTPVADASEVGEGGSVDGDRIVLVDGLGTVSALDRRTGGRIWAHQLRAPVFRGRPIAIDDALVLRDITGVIEVLDRRTGRHRGSFRATGVGVGLGAGASGLVLARSQVGHHQVVGLPAAMLAMRTGTGTPPVPVPVGPARG